MGFLSHLVAELKEGLGTFVRAWAVAVALAVVLGLVLLVGVALPDPKLATGDKLVAVVVVPVYAAVQGLWLGVFVGAGAVLVRIAGAATLLPVLLAVGGAGLAWGLGFDHVANAWTALTVAVGDRAGELGGGGMGSCASPAVLVILVPILLIHFLAAPKILAALLWFVLVAAGLLLAGGVAGASISLPPLLLVVAGRLKERARAREAAAPKPA